MVDVEIFPPFGAPVAKAISLPLLAVEEWRTATIDGLLMIDIDAGRGAGSETRAVLPSWSFGTDDTYLRDWTNLSGVAERSEVDQVWSAYLADLMSIYGAETCDVIAPMQAFLNINVKLLDITRDQLPDLVRAALGFPGITITEADKNRTWDLWFETYDLDKHAFWEEKQNLFGDGCWGLYRSCSAPNVGWKLRSNAQLEPDRPFTVFMHRAMPHQEQATPWFRIEWGDYIFEIRKDQEVKFYRYQPTLSLADRAILTAQLELVEAGGQLVAAKRAQIQQYTDAAAALKKAAKQSRRKMTADQEIQIAGYESQIKQLKSEARGLDQAAQAEAAALTKQLYAQVESASFTDSIETFYGVDLPITFVPHRRGFVSIHVGHPNNRNYWVFADKHLLDRREWGTTIWAATDPRSDTRTIPTHLTLSSNGGAFWFRFAYVQGRKYSTIVSALHRADRDLEMLTSNDLIAVPYWDPIPGVWNPITRTWTGAVPTLTARIVPDASQGHGRFRWEMALTSDSYHLPILYGLQLTVMAEPRDRAQEQLLWSSRATPQIVLSATPRQGELGESVSWDVVLFDETGVLPQTLGTLYNKQIRLKERLSGRSLFFGIITDCKTEFIGAHGACRMTLTCGDRCVILAQGQIEVETPGDGLVMKQYLRLEMREQGFHDDELLIADCPQTLKQLPNTDPGEKPKLRPEWGSKRSEFLRALSEGYTYGTTSYFDGEGRWHWEPKLAAVRGDVTFRPYHQQSTDRRVMRGIQEWIDFSEFYNDFIVIGGTPPGAAQPVVARFQDYRSVNDPTYWQYIRTWKPLEPVRDDSLRYQAEVDVAVRRLVELHMAKWFVSFETYYQDDLDMRSRFWIILRRSFGEERLPVQIQTIDSVDRNEDSMQLTVRIIQPWP